MSVEEKSLNQDSWRIEMSAMTSQEIGMYPEVPWRVELTAMASRDPRVLADHLK